MSRQVAEALPGTPGRGALGGRTPLLPVEDWSALGLGQFHQLVRSRNNRRLSLPRRGLRLAYPNAEHSFFDRAPDHLSLLPGEAESVGEIGTGAVSKPELEGPGISGKKDLSLG